MQHGLAFLQQRREFGQLQAEGDPFDGAGQRPRSDHAQHQDERGVAGDHRSVVAQLGGDVSFQDADRDLSDDRAGRTEDRCLAVGRVAQAAPVDAGVGTPVQGGYGLLQPLADQCWVGVGEAQTGPVGDHHVVGAAGVLDPASQILQDAAGVRVSDASADLGDLRHRRGNANRASLVLAIQ